MVEQTNMRTVNMSSAGLETGADETKISAPGFLPFDEVYRIAAEQFRFGLYVLQNGLFQYVNRWFADALDYKNEEELIGTSFWGMVYPDDRKLVKLLMPADSAADFFKQPSFRLLNKDGYPVWVRMGGKVFTYKGKPASVGFMFNVNAIQSRIETIHDSLQRYKTILDDVDVQLSELDLQGNLTFINDAGCRMWKLSREELLGMNYRQYMKDHDARQYQDLYMQVYRTGIPVKNVILEVVDREGKKRTIEKSVSLARDAKGNTAGFRMVSRDITDRREAENKLAEQRSRLEAIFGSVKDAIITVDPNLRIIEANKSTEVICGIVLKESVGRIMSECRIYCGHSCQEVLRQTIDKKAAIKEYRIECERTDRPHQVVSVSSSPLLDSNDNFLGAVLVIRDITLLRDIERELRQRNRFQDLIGRNKTMQDIYNLLEDLANLDTAVLVTGESGTGKELVARALHYGGNRAFRPFVTVNCSALAESLLESELFGHVRGAFTGAIKDKQGRFSAANGGTLLLDEIGDISPLIQLKLLRVLQEKEFERVGESTPQKVNVRIIACTNKDLKEKVNRGEFRQDLYYRLKVVEISLPPLRKRLEDIPLLVDHFRSSFNKRFNKNVEGISVDVLNAFMNYPWPGNVRELEHVMEHAFVLCHGETITMKHLPADIRNFIQQAGAPSVKAQVKKTQNDLQNIDDALKKANGNKTKAARLLGISRRTIYRKLGNHHLRTEQ